MELEADILDKLITYWQLDHVILFGHSDGGSIALIAGGKYPNKINGIITEGAHIFVEEVTTKGIEAAVELYKTTDLKSKLTKYHGNKTEALFWVWASTWVTEEFKHWNIETFLPQLVCPSLIIQGKEDEYGTIDQVNKIVSQTKGESNALLIPKVKHTPHKEVSELILSKSAEFILEKIL